MSNSPASRATPASPASPTSPSDPVADDIESRNVATEDISAGEQVLDEGRVAPEPDDFTNGDSAKSSEAHEKD